MSPTTGIGHVAVLTEDLDRFVDFSTSVFEAEVVFTETTPRSCPRAASAQRRPATAPPSTGR